MDFSLLTNAQEKLLYSALLSCSLWFPNNCENFAASSLSEGFFVCNFCFIEGQKSSGKKIKVFLTRRESFSNKAISQACELASLIFVTLRKDMHAVQF